MDRSLNVQASLQTQATWSRILSSSLISAYRQSNHRNETSGQSIASRRQSSKLDRLQQSPENLSSTLAEDLVKTAVFKTRAKTSNLRSHSATQQSLICQKQSKKRVGAARLTRQSKAPNVAHTCKQSHLSQPVSNKSSRRRPKRSLAHLYRNQNNRLHLKRTLLRSSNR